MWLLFKLLLMSKKHTDKDKKKIALKIKQFREKKNLTQEDLARMLHTSVFTVSRLERGKNYPTGSTVQLMRMLKVLDEKED